MSHPNEVTMVPCSPDDSWARVELFRLQYGGLPHPNDDRKVDARKGLEKFADQIEEAYKLGDYSKLPPLCNLVDILRYCSRHIPA